MQRDHVSPRGKMAFVGSFVSKGHLDSTVTGLRCCFRKGIYMIECVCVCDFGSVVGKSKSKLATVDADDCPV